MMSESCLGFHRDHGTVLLCVVCCGVWGGYHSRSGGGGGAPPACESRPRLICLRHRSNPPLAPREVVVEGAGCGKGPSEPENKSDSGKSHVPGCHQPFSSGKRGPRIHRQGPWFPPPRCVPRPPPPRPLHNAAHTIAAPLHL